MKWSQYPALLSAACVLWSALGCTPPLAGSKDRPEAGLLGAEPPHSSTVVTADAGASEAGAAPLDAAVDAMAGSVPAASDAGAGDDDAAAPEDAPPGGAADVFNAIGPAWHGGGLIVAVGNDGRRMVSGDGKVWSGDQRDTSGNRDGPKALRAVAYGDHKVVAVGGGCAPTCTSRIVTFDGATWREEDASAGKGRLNGVAYGNGAWVAVGSSPPILRSTDGGRTWLPASKLAVPEGLRAVAFGQVGGQGTFVAVGDGYTRVSSTDGLTWSNLHASDGTAEGFRAVAIGNDVVVAVGGKTDAGRRMRSIDGIAWSDDLTGGPDLFSLVFVGGEFLAFSGAGDDTLHASTDGREWMTQQTTNAGSNVAGGLLQGNRFFVSRVSPSSIRISIDGYVWAQTPVMSMPGDSILNAFTIAGN
jgi:hypothetical protein